jgi:hypothetical protein
MSRKHCKCCKICGGVELSTQDKIGVLGQAGIQALKLIPIVGQVSSIIDPIAEKYISKLPSNTLDNAKRSYQEKYSNLFGDDQYIYNPDGSYKYPKNLQFWYMLGQRWLLDHNQIHGSPEYHQYINLMQKRLRLSDKVIRDNIAWLVLDHNH